MSAARLPRGLRNRNPGNLRRSKDPWQGLARVQADPEFFTFESAPYGIRALARTLITYQDKHGLHTVRGLIQRWAPPSENDTDAYIRYVARAINVRPDDRIDMQDHATLKAMVKAIIQHENGQQPYSDVEIDKGLILAGVETAAPKRLRETGTAKGAAGAVGAAAGTGVVAEVVDQAAPYVGVLGTVRDWLDEYKWPIIVLALLAGIGFMLYRRWDDWRKLAR